MVAMKSMPVSWLNNWKPLDNFKSLLKSGLLSIMCNILLTKYVFQFVFESIKFVFSEKLLYRKCEIKLTCYLFFKYVLNVDISHNH